jgi:hypothetical protein
MEKSELYGALIFVGFVALIGVVVIAVVAAHRKEVRRREHLAWWAGQHGWTFDKDPDHLPAMIAPVLYLASLLTTVRGDPRSASRR